MCYVWYGSFSNQKNVCGLSLLSFYLHNKFVENILEKLIELCSKSFMVDLSLILPILSLKLFIPETGKLVFLKMFGLQFPSTTTNLINDKGTYVFQNIFFYLTMYVFIYVIKIYTIPITNLDRLHNKVVKEQSND